MQELEHQVKLIEGVAKGVFWETGSSVNYKVGTMIEVPRAAFIADEVSLDDSFSKIFTNMWPSFRVLFE